jgi:hypothetical protein
MKKLIYLLIVCIGTSYGCAQSTNLIWNATIRVLDEAGQPVADSKAEMDWNVNAPDLTVTFGKSEGLTDTNGIFKTSHEANGSTDLGFGASKAGYYSTRASHEIAPLNDSDTAKWNHNVTLVLKKIWKPIPMYAKQIDSLKIPEMNKAIGYDLMVGDWIGPYGKGVNTDLFFTEKHTDPQSGYILSVSFPKPGDGIQEFDVPALIQNAVNGASDLRSSQNAPIDRYQREVSQTETTNPNRNFYFRVRTKLDENGNVVSAHYGKIYGDLAQFTYYFNPTPNDRNVEFDPKQNMLGGLQSFEQVRRP